jgi:hypothetical protein
MAESLVKNLEMLGLKKQVRQATLQDYLAAHRVRIHNPLVVLKPLNRRGYCGRSTVGLPQ